MFKLSFSRETISSAKSLPLPYASIGERRTLNRSKLFYGFSSSGRGDDAKKSCQIALEKIEELEKITETVLGKESPHNKNLQETVKQNFQEKLQPIVKDIG